MVWGITVSLIFGASMLSSLAILAAMRAKARYEEAAALAEQRTLRPTEALHPAVRARVRRVAPRLV